MNILKKYLSLQYLKFTIYIIMYKKSDFDFKSSFIESACGELDLEVSFCVLCAHSSVRASGFGLFRSYLHNESADFNIT